MKTQTHNAHTESRPGDMGTCLVSTGRLSLCAERGVEMEEEWRPIRESPDYAVSNLGRVKRITDSCRQYKAGMILKQNHHPKGYLYCALYKDGKSKNRFIHHLVLEEFIGPRPLREECNHQDGVKRNNTPDNLEWATHSENEKHAYRTGLKFQGAGDDCQNSKLKSGEVWLIKKLLASGILRQGAIAKMFRVGRENISAIHCGKSWAHITYL